MTQGIHPEIKLGLLDEIFHLPAFMIDSDDLLRMSRQVGDNKSVSWAQLVGMAFDPADDTAGFVPASGLIIEIMIKTVAFAVISPIVSIKLIVSRPRTGRELGIEF